MEKQKEVEEYIEKITKPIFNRVLQEAPSNHRQVGSAKKKKLIKYFAQPHDYRLYFDFSRDNFQPEKLDNQAFSRVLKRDKIPLLNNDYKYECRNYNSEHHYKKFLYCTLKVRKNTIEITNHKTGKQWFEIKGSISEINKKVDFLKEYFENDCREVIKTFIKLHGGKSELKLLSGRPEIGLHGDEYLDNIPEDMIIRDTFFKKLYKKKVEMYGWGSVKNYISNRAIEDIAPEIANELNNISQGINKLNPTLLEINKSMQLEIKNKKLHRKVLKSMDKTLKDIRDDLKQKRIKDYF